VFIELSQKNGFAAARRIDANDMASEIAYEVATWDPSRESKALTVGNRVDNRAAYFEPVRFWMKCNNSVSYPPWTLRLLPNAVGPASRR
jgi:hypothetical protein